MIRNDTIRFDISGSEWDIVVGWLGIRHRHEESSHSSMDGRNFFSMIVEDGSYFFLCG